VRVTSVILLGQAVTCSRGGQRRVIRAKPRSPLAAQAAPNRVICRAECASTGGSPCTLIGDLCGSAGQSQDERRHTRALGLVSERNLNARTSDLRFCHQVQAGKE
jgi:hypothetical protein